MNFLNDINLNRNNDGKYLILLLIFSIILTITLLKFHLTRGAYNSDLYVYLAGALDLAGLNINHISNTIWIQNSPVIIFLTSLLFRIGFVDFSSILIVSGFFGIIGIFGMYTLLKIRFSPILSFTGAILYHSLSLTLYYFANGMLDVPAVAILIWTLIFTVTAVDKNPKYYMLVSISFSISFFIRYTNAYIISLIILYSLKKYDIINLMECFFKDKKIFKDRIIYFTKSQEFKWIIISMLFTLITFIFVFWILFSFDSKIIYFEAAKGSLSRYSNHNDANFVIDKWFFIKNFLNMLSCKTITFNKLYVEKFNQATIFSYLIITILISGIILKIINYSKNLDFFKNNLNSYKYRTKTSKIFLNSLILILFVIARYGFRLNYLITLACFWIIFIILMSLIKEYPINFDNFSLSILFMALFSFYLIIVSFIDLKCFRYLLPAFPGFIYFVIYSLDYICEFIKNGFDDKNSLIKKFKNEKISYNSEIRNNLSKLIPIILILICLISIFNFTSTVELNPDGINRIEICNFIKQYDPNYQTKEFLGWLDIRYFEWYLNKDITKFDEVDEINPSNYNYIITFDNSFNDSNYKEVYHIGHYYLNENINRK